jgi:hypothetical protein
VLVSLPHIWRRVADGSHRIVAFVMNRCVAGVNFPWVAA